jgi:uracil-DNA glycosylase
MPLPLADCRRCARFRHQFKKLRLEFPDYWNQPVPAVGDQKSPLMILGLAPGKHGANRTGVPFTGDASGELLFSTLRQLNLQDSVVITNAVKCLPINNKPASTEINNCQRYLTPEVQDHLRKSCSTFLALGRVAHNALLKALGVRQVDHPFVHGGDHELPDAVRIVDSYHCSRYNTQTGRLTAAMFHDAVAKAAVLAGLREGVPSV